VRTTKDVKHGGERSRIEMEFPKKLENPDFSALVEAVKEYMEYIGSEDRHEDRDEKYTNPIFEAAVESVYGSKAFDYVNKAMDDYDKRIYREEEE
jgi:hypothetical protein